MPVNSADQQITTPVLGDPANIVTAFGDYTTDVEPRLVKKYADAADRTARNAAPTNGEVSFLTNPGRYEVWMAPVVSAWWEMRKLYITKATETQVVNNSTALVNDSHLLLPLQINARYELKGMIVLDTGTTSDFKCDWTGPAGFSMPRWLTQAPDTAANVNRGSAAASNVQTVNGAGIGTFLYVPITGIVVTAGTAGNLQFRWAQNTLEAVNTRVKTDSYIALTRVG
jgi:hypothetical protein